MRTRVAGVLVALGILATFAACSARREGTVGPAAAIDTPGERRGQEVFMEHCERCHPRGTAGVGPALNDKPLPEFAMRSQIRNGVGAMPGYAEQVINEDQMDDLIEYLKTLRTGE